MSLQMEIDHREDLLGVRDQGQLPTCLAHATSTVHSVNKDIKTPLSAETLHYHATGADWDNGSGIKEIQQALCTEGQPQVQHCDSISRENAESWSPPTDVPFYQSQSNQETPSPRMIKEAIRESKLPVLGVGIPSSFYDPDPPWIISAGKCRDLHAVVAVGIARHEDETLVLIRNSWGDDWANSGHAWLDNSFLEKHLRDVLILLGGVDK